MERLIVLPEDRAAAQALEASFDQILQRLGERLLICETALTSEAVSALGGRIIGSEKDMTALGELPAVTRLFILAWLERLRKPEKERPGEGLDWDTPPFKAP